MSVLKKTDEATGDAIESATEEAAEQGRGGGQQSRDGGDGHECQECSPADTEEVRKEASRKYRTPRKWG
jgi:galactokinase/mevalonate kinase-like predicted kinase